MNHITNDFENYTKEQLVPLADRLEWANCKKCGGDVVISMKGMDFFEHVAKLGFDSCHIPTANSLVKICHTCQSKLAQERTAKLMPRYARKAVKAVKPAFICPLYDCHKSFTSKKELKTHIETCHDTWHMEEHLGLKHPGQ